MIIKIHKSQGRILVALCDKELLGKKFSGENCELDLGSDFFKGEEKTEREIGDILRNSWTSNIVGRKSIDLALKEEVISEEHVKEIDGVPYALIITL